MIIDSENAFNEGINEIINYTKDKKLKEVVMDTIEKYSKLDSKFNKKNAIQVIESLKWIAEKNKDSNDVRSAAECFLMNSVMEAAVKYHGDVSDEVFSNVIWKIEEHLDKNTVRKYINWINNGHISKLLDFAEELNGNGNLKIKTDIFSIIDVNESGLEKFDFYADKINDKKLFLEKKLELFSILRDIINKNKDEYAEILVNKGIKDLTKCVENDLNRIKSFNEISSLKCAIKFIEDKKKNGNVEFLFSKCKEFGNIRKWLFADEVVQNVIKEIENAGFDSNLYISSGELIAQKRIEGHFSESWSNVLKSIVIKIVGSKRNKTLPKISVPKTAPGAIFKKIKNYYFDALNQDKNAAKKVLKVLKELIQKSYSGRKIPKSVNEILNDIDSLEKALVYGGIATLKGAKVVAKVWKRKIPEDLYDSEKLYCCVFLPEGERGEIPLFMMDPKTTLLQYYIQGIHDPISIAFLYAGLVDNKPALFIDTWEGGALVYAALGQEKMKDFIYKSILKFAKKVGAKKVAFYAKPKYGRAKEFCSYLRDIGLESKKIYFEAIDSEDSVLQSYSQGKKHHYTDAFYTKPIKGKIEAFVVEL
jgi:hypothetical protein